MARSLEQLQKQYNQSAAAKKAFMGRGGPRGHGGRGMPRAKLKNTKGTIKRLFSYLSKHTLGLVCVLGLMLLSTLTSLCGSYLLAPIINRLTIATTGKEIELSAMEALAESVFARVVPADADVLTYVLSVLTIFACIYAVGIVTTYLQAKIMLTISQKAIENLRNDLFTKLQRLPVRYFDANPTGEIMSRFTNDIDNIEMMINHTLTSLVSGAVTLVGTFIFMLTTNIVLTMVTVVFIPIFAFGGGAIAKLSSKYYSAQQAALGAINGFTEETVTGQKVVKVFNHEKNCVDEFSLLNGDMRQKQFNAQVWGSIMGPIMGNTSQISFGVTIGIGGVLMVLGKLTPGALSVFANYSRHFSQPINALAQQTSTIFSALAGAERVFEVMDTTPELEDTENAVQEGIKGHVILNNVTFGYNPDKTVLKNISLYAKPGQKIAFVGSTGAGKTTITNLLNRFYDIQEGEILIDGVNVKDYKRDYLRSNIAMVLQDTHLFTGTVRENIRYGRPDATDEEVVQAAKTASAHSFIMRLENGYDTVLEGDGANLSQGQRQLLNIARAAISNAPILVLDEATSSVDTRTERHIERGMDRLMKDRTTFVIAHRLSTVRNANAIMVLEQGEIIERGDHNSLLEQKGRYYELYTGVKELD